MTITQMILNVTATCYGMLHIQSCFDVSTGTLEIIFVFLVLNSLPVSLVSLLVFAYNHTPSYTDIYFYTKQKYILPEFTPELRLSDEPAHKRVPQSEAL